MTNDEALAEIRRLALGGQVAFTDHAQRRVEERGLTKPEVRYALAIASSVRLTAEENWRVISTDRIGDELVVIVAIEAYAVVVTVF